MLSSSFQNVEFPCDWTVNRRPTQQQSATEPFLQQPGKGRGGGDAKSKKTGGTKRAMMVSDSNSTKKCNQPHNNQKPIASEGPIEKETVLAAASLNEKKETPLIIITEHIEAHPLGPLSTSISSQIAEKNEASSMNAIITSSTLGVDHNNNTSKKRVRHLVLKHLRQREEEGETTRVSTNGIEPPTTTTIGIDTEGLLSRLPYKKMLSDMFGGNLRGNMQNPTIPYVTRAYEEAFMREPMHANERECARGKKCECMFIDRGQPFVGVEFLLPGESVPRTPHLCVLCCRATTQQLYHDVMFDRVEFPGCIQRFGNIHSEPGEYSLDAMLIAVHTAPVHVMPLPIVSHQRNRYNVYVTGGIKHLKQSRVHFHFTPSCFAESGI